MKNVLSFNNTMLITIFFFTSFTIIFIPSCTISKTTEIETTTQSTKSVPEDVSVRESDQQFLVSAVSFSHDQVSLGELAQYRGKTSHIKRFGVRMQEFHTDALNHLNKLAKSKGVNIPTNISEKGKADFKILNEIERSEFDLKYSDIMVSRHNDALNLFEKAAWISSDPEISTWARATLPKIRTHLDEARECISKSERM